MRVCLVHEEFPDETNYGGIATYQKRLAESLVEAGIEVIVLTKSLECDKDYIENKIRIIKIYAEKEDNIYNEYYNYRVKVSEKLRELQSNNEIDIIEVPDWGAETVLFEKYRRIPLIVRLHTPLAIWSKANGSMLDESIHEKMLKWEKKMIECADKVTSCTTILKDMVKDELEIKRDDIEVIPNPANLKDFYSKNTNKTKSKNILYCGSIEQRKGVITLARAIPDVLKKLKNVKFIFVGKDTNRNDKGISTISYIKEIIPEKYHKNLEFKDILPNEELNVIYNNACIGVYPSLFDNFPYVVLESMACGLPFVGSINSGMKEMIDEYDKYLCNTEDSQELAQKIIELYKNKKDQKQMSKYILEKVKDKYSSSKIVDDFISLYEKTITDYNESLIKKFVKTNIKEKIIDLKKLDGGLANVVYLLTTPLKKYIIKIYKKDIDQDAIDALIKISNKNDIRVLKTVDNNFYNYENSTICIYDYIEGKHIKKLSKGQIDKIIDFISIPKKSRGMYNNLLDKVNFYYDSLRELDTKKIRREVIDELLRRYMKLQNYSIFYEKELVHGDLAPNNIIWDDDNNFTLIDLDETIEFTRLYDLIVFAIKFSKNGSEIDVKMAKKILKPFDNFDKVDIINVWNFYILKVILEKIYLYEIGKIDLRDERQLRDNWEDWYAILNSSIIEDILNK